VIKGNTKTNGIQAQRSRPVLQSHSSPSGFQLARETGVDSKARSFSAWSLLVSTRRGEGVGSCTIVIVIIDSGEAVEHRRNERPARNPNPLGLNPAAFWRLAAPDWRLAFLDNILWTADSIRWVRWCDLANDQEIKRREFSSFR